MSFITETIGNKNSILVVSEKNEDFIKIFRGELQRYNVEFYFSPRIPPHLERFDYCFFINQTHIPKRVLEKKIGVSLIYLNSEEEAKKKSKLPHSQRIKIISLKGETYTKDHVEKILWFSFSDTKESFLSLLATGSKRTIRRGYSSLRIGMPTKRSLIFLFFFFIIISHLLFIPFLALSSYFLYRGATSIESYQMNDLKKYLRLADPFLNISKKLYSIPRTTYLIFSITFPNDVIILNEKTYDALTRITSLQENGAQLVSLFLAKNKSPQDMNTFQLRLKKLKVDIKEIDNDVSVINQKIPSSLKSAKDRLNQTIRLLDQIDKLLPSMDYLLGKDGTHTYLILFANNMELRPGGGFIGSFGIATIDNYTFEGIKIYDVYDADGQLALHVEPPAAIRTHLGQPNWFLRDSAFSPDFSENYQQALFFLDKELNMKNFSGGILLTTTAIQNVLGAFGEVYLPDFHEKVNKNNFYLKAQIYAESDFFPGSIQKKNFLGDLAQYLLLNLDTVELPLLAKSLKTSLDEKQITLFFEQADLQSTIDKLYWSGKVINAACPTSENYCISDYLFPVDANLGVNKANFFLSRSYDLNLTVDKEGTIRNTLSIQFKNDSLENVFPGGTYKNYFQLFFSPDASIESVTKDGIRIEDYDTKVNEYRHIGMLLEIKPKTITDLKIVYARKKVLKKGKNIYQLILQKQIGSSKSDLSLHISPSRGITMASQNFPVLVKDNSMIYNTSLSQDKIFFIELTKE